MTSDDDRCVENVRAPLLNHYYSSYSWLKYVVFSSTAHKIQIGMCNLHNFGFRFFHSHVVSCEISWSLLCLNLHPRRIVQRSFLMKQPFPENEHTNCGRVRSHVYSNFLGHLHANEVAWKILKSSKNLARVGSSKSKI